jgi:hypothetical protein
VRGKAAAVGGREEEPNGTEVIAGQRAITPRRVPLCGEGCGDTQGDHFQVGLSVKNRRKAARRVPAVEPCLGHSASKKTWSVSPRTAALVKGAAPGVGTRAFMRIRREIRVERLAPIHPAGSEIRRSARCATRIPLVGKRAMRHYASWRARCVSRELWAQGRRLTNLRHRSSRRRPSRLTYPGESNRASQRFRSWRRRRNCAGHGWCWWRSCWSS